MESQQTPLQQEPTPPQPEQQPANSAEAVVPEEAPRIHSSIEAATSPGEHVIFQTRKHFFGLAIMYLQAIVAFLVVAGLLLFLTPSVADAGNEGTIRSAVLIILVVFGGLLALIMLLVTYIYRQNKLILTNRNVTQIIQKSLFSRQVSELALNNVEDVTADKQGIWSMIFNFGEVRVETAGEQNNFHFKYCPNPNYYGQQLLDMRQQCLRNNNAPH